MKKVHKEVNLKLEYYQNKVDRFKSILEGGVVEPDIDDLIVDVTDGEIFNMETDEFVSNGKYEIHIKGSRKAIKEFGKYLVALSEYETEDPKYHDHFDNVQNSSGEDSVDFVIYKPEK